MMRGGRGFAKISTNGALYLRYPIRWWLRGTCIFCYMCLYMCFKSA